MRDSRRGQVVQRVSVALCVLVIAAFTAAGCGGKADNANGAVVIGFMTWGDPTGASDKMYRACEKESGNKYRIDPVAMGPSVDAAREQLTRRLGAGDTSIDLINLDTIWTAEFADAGWLMDISDRIGPIKDTFVASSLDSAYYKGKYWAMPVNTNAALLYYRTDLVKKPPTTWEELKADAQAVQKTHPDMAGFVFQGAPSESGTVDALEYLLSSGAKVLDKSGKHSLIDEGGGAEHAFTFLRGMIKDGVAPKVVTTYMEEEARAAFQNGGAVFMRNWPYADPLMKTDKTSKVKGKFALAELPTFEGQEPITVLGGQNFGMSSHTDNPKLAWEALKCLGSAKMQSIKATVKGELPALQSLYDAPDLRKKITYLPFSKIAISRGRNRPKTPYYGDVTSAIYHAYNDVLAGHISPRDAVKRMDRGIQAAIDGKAEI
ncbi:MAG: extracellular solute-binding protein family 1 [Thermoleophilia bacterium]|nr:extracellular solute-binding protein family 1 [Thermoleophilia bacterium]